MSAKYQQNEKHFNYTTPKSFLEFMKLYGNLLGKKRTELSQKMERLESGLQKLQSTASQVTLNRGRVEVVRLWLFVRYFSSGTCSVAQVEDLKAKLALQEVELWQRNNDIEALIAKIGQQTDKLNQERAVADAEEQKVGTDCSLMSQFWPFKNILCLPLYFWNNFVFLRQVAAIQAEVTKQQQETEEDLAKAEPALQAANAALNTLNRVSQPPGR